MIRLSDVRLPLEYTDETLFKTVCKQLRTDREAIKNISLFRRSVDARKKSDVHFTAALDVELNLCEARVLSRAKNAKAQAVSEYRYERLYPKNPVKSPVLVVGAGPAGLFAALTLVKSGVPCILVERGRDVDSRVKDVEAFNTEKRLSISSNIQFGEGGAGTFSDGKLNTGTKNTRARQVLIELAAHGAPKEILYNAKPHVGTDKLRLTVKNIRKTLINSGCRVMFETKLVGIRQSNGRVKAAELEQNGKTFLIDTDKTILAIGHSARDTFEFLAYDKLAMEQKPFSVGARIEHPQQLIDCSQYGSFAGHKALGAADYKLSVHLENGRGVYTFCMCPGGSVVAAASEESSVVTNGMSCFARDGVNANSALLVSVDSRDFPSKGVLSGMYFQRELEQKAFLLGGSDYSAPVQKVGDFLSGTLSKGFGKVLPTYPAGTNFARLDELFPKYITESLQAGIVEMNKRLHGFSDADAVLTGVETRSSSPVRLVRNEELCSASMQGLYPCGEGAGYAGGIISAAVDGIRCAEAVITSY